LFAYKQIIDLKTSTIWLEHPGYNRFIVHSVSIGARWQIRCYVYRERFVALYDVRAIIIDSLNSKYHFCKHICCRKRYCWCWCVYFVAVEQFHCLH